jgi:hypothetical protein
MSVGISVNDVTFHGTDRTIGETRVAGRNKHRHGGKNRQMQQSGCKNPILSASIFA